MREAGLIRTPGALADFFAALPVRVSSVRVRQGAVSVADYPGGARPTSTVCLAGDGQEGFGENVAFTAEEHERFAAGAAGWLHGGEGVRAGAVAALMRPAIPGYARAALEGALVDLALRQAGVSLADLTGGGAAREAGAPGRWARFRFVVSFAARADPAAQIRRLRAAGYTGAFKIDVDPSWDRPTCEDLATEPGVAILDFKGRGDAALARRLAALFPDALLEDPPPGTTVAARIARDASLADAAAVAAAWARGESVNLKAPRMGGPLAVLRGLEHAGRTTHISLPADRASDGLLTAPTAYLGGMFEVGVGRTQARQLAALFCADAPNDLAPVAGSLADPSATLVRLDAPGFGVDGGAVLPLTEMIGDGGGNDGEPRGPS